MNMLLKDFDLEEFVQLSLGQQESLNVCPNCGEVKWLSPETGKCLNCEGE
jgi:hypothetical protein